MTDYAIQNERNLPATRIATEHLKDGQRDEENEQFNKSWRLTQSLCNF